MKWTKHHRDIWLDARLRVHPVEVRCLLLDLQALSDEAGVVTEDHEDIALLAGLQPDSLKKALEALQRLGLISILDSGNLAVTSCVEDSEYRDSRRAGGVAARDAGKMPKRCPSDASRVPKGTSASPLASGSSGISGPLASGSSGSLGSEGKSAEKGTAASRLVSDFWCDRFLKIRGSKYVWQGGKDGALLAKLLKATGSDVAEVQTRIERFLTDPFWAPKADWAKFCSQYNAMAGPAKTADPFAEAARMLGVEAPL